MKRYLIVPVFLLATVSLLAQDKPAVPNQQGMFYQTPTGYTRAERIDSTGLKNSGVAKSAFTYGIAKAGVDITYANPNAILQLTDRRPVFVLVSQAEVSTQQIILVRFRQKKDRREIKKCNASMWAGINCSVEGRVPLNVDRDPSDNLVITPTTDLAPGEYFLLTGNMAGWGENSGYDFGER
jgi:hypothetical protein